MVTPRATNYTSARNEPPRVLSLQLYQIQPKVYLGKRNENFGVLAARLLLYCTRFSHQ